MCEEETDFLYDFGLSRHSDRQNSDPSFSFAFYLYVSIVLPHNFTHISKSYTVAILVTVIGTKTGPENTFPGMSGNTRSVVFDRNQ